MIKTIFKNLIAGSATRSYPMDVRPGFENARGALRNDIRGCTLCGICARKCPSQCIRVDKKRGMWELTPHACVLCGICVDACPRSCLGHDSTHPGPIREKALLRLEKASEPTRLVDKKQTGQ